MLDTATERLSKPQLFDAAPERFAGAGRLTGTASSGPYWPRTGNSEAMLSWYVVHHRPSVGPVLAERIAGLGFAVRRFREERRRRGRDDWFEPVFPGYLFVRFDLSERDSWGPIFRQHGALGILGVRIGEYCRPIPVPQVRMEELLDIFDERGEKRLPPPLPAKRRAVGSKLRVIGDSPWTDFIGVCQASGRDRVQMLMQIFGRQTPVELSASQVREVE